MERNIREFCTRKRGKTLKRKFEKLLARPIRIFLEFYQECMELNTENSHFSILKFDNDIVLTNKFFTPSARSSALDSCSKDYCSTDFGNSLEFCYSCPL